MRDLDALAGAKEINRVFTCNVAATYRGVTYFVGTTTIIAIAAAPENRFVLTTGFSYVLQADALGTVGRLNDDMQWLYLQLDAIF